MIDLGQAITAQNRRAGAIKAPFADPAERRARNLALATDKPSDWTYYHHLRAERLRNAKH